MSIKKVNEKYLVDLRPDGRNGRRVRKSFSTKGEAIRFQNWVISQSDSDKPWQEQKADTRKISDLAKIWFDSYGKLLKDGDARKRQLDNLAKLSGDPLAREFTPAIYTKLRTERLKTTGPATCNRDLSYLKAVFNELRRSGQIDYPNPLADVRQLRYDEPELSFFTREQIPAILQAASESESDILLIIKTGLCTGARWSEIVNLRPSQVLADRISFTRTKSSKNRTVPIDPALAAEIRAALPFKATYSAFRWCVERRLGWELPKGQLTHILRHTFASHFMQNGGNILVLQKVLGHSSLKMTMRYAHLAPEHLQQARELNPLANLGKNGELGSGKKKQRGQFVDRQ